MKKIWMIIFLTASAITAQASVKSPYVYITIGSDAVQTSQKSFSGMKKVDQADGISILKINKNEIENLSKLMHDKFNRCGGFVLHDSKEEAQKVINDNVMRRLAKNTQFSDYTITEGAKVQAMVSMVKEYDIRSTIKKLSTYKNRYYKSQW